MALAQNIRYLRKKQGWGQDTLAEKLGYKSYTTIQKWESGVSEPPLKIVHALAKLFCVDINDLTSIDLESADSMKASTPAQSNIIPPGYSPMPDTEFRPRVGRIACGEPITAEENIEAYDEVLTSWHADFTLVCCGDSMLPKFEDGDIVAIRSQPTVENGQIAAVRIGNEATLKQVFVHPDYIELRPINSAYQSIIRRKEEMDDVKIEGRAVGLCRNL